MSGCRCSLNIVIYICGVTYEWMSSIFKVLFLFWFMVMYLSSSWEDMDVPVELLTHDVWAAENDITGLLNVGVDCFGQLYI